MLKQTWTLHDVAEKIISLASSGKTLTMDDYVSIVGSQEDIEEIQNDASKSGYYKIIYDTA
jgi:hypothetical protein